MKEATECLQILGIRLPISEAVFRLPPQVRRFMLPVSVAIGCLASVSCQTSGVPQPQVQTACYQSGHWTRVATKPPTYYPQGVASDTPTDWSCGEWFRLCDAADTRYYIPFKLPAGRNRQRLVNEVCALRTEDYDRQIAKEDTEESVNSLKRFAKYSPALVPLNTGLVLVSCIAGAGGGGPLWVSPDDFELWLHNWKKDYGSR